MGRYVFALCLMTAAALSANPQTREPDKAQQNSILERIKTAAVNYADHLQDFICIESIRRSKEDGLIKRWQPLDTEERELSYFSQKEHYRTLTVNGKPPSPGNQIKPGYFLAGGEFGPALDYIFNPKNSADFQWDHAEAAGSARLCVFRYRVTQKDGTMKLFANGDTVHMQHHGLLYADCDRAALARIQIETEPATVVQNGVKIALGWKIDIRYGMTPIAGKEFLLPQQSEEQVRFGGTQTKVEIQFQQYKKYDSSSKVTFDSEGKP